MANFFYLELARFLIFFEEVTSRNVSFRNNIFEIEIIRIRINKMKYRRINALMMNKYGISQVTSFFSFLPIWPKRLNLGT